MVAVLAPVLDDLDVDLRAVQGLSDAPHQPDHDVFQALSLRVVVENERTIAVPCAASEGWGAHAGVDGGQVVVQGVEVLQEVTCRRAQTFRILS